MLTLTYFILLVLLLPAGAAAQSKTCALCGKAISGSYVSAGNSYYHPGHFLCYKCGEPIKGEYNEENGNYFHPACYQDVNSPKCAICGEYINGTYVKAGGKSYHRECYEQNEMPRCAFCNKPITGHYVVFEGVKYHDYCYKSDVAEKCDICGGALTGRYTEDLYGNKYHTKHEADYGRCDNCKRIISTGTTGGGVKYNDGREICAICYNNSYKGELDTEKLLNNVLDRLKYFGFEIDRASVTVNAGGRNDLQKAAGKMYSGSMNGYCATTIQRYKKNGITENKYMHKIYLLDKVPLVYVEAALVHELMHVWLHSNTGGRHMSDLREGSCNYLSYIYIEKFGGAGNLELLKQFDNDPNFIYGEGFRKVKEKFYGKNVSIFFDYLRGKTNI